MDATYRTFNGILNVIKSWIPWKSEPDNVSKAFWMPDQSCRVCYECDSQFTITKRRHHCRLCGRIFCSRCTSNSIPAPREDTRTSWEERQRIRVCNYCYKLWEQGIATPDNGLRVSNPDLGISLSDASFASSSRSCSIEDGSSYTLDSRYYSVGSSQLVQDNSGLSPYQSSIPGPSTVSQSLLPSGKCDVLHVESQHPPQNKYSFSTNRSDDDDDDYYSVYQLDTEARSSPQVNGCYGQSEFDEMSNEDRSDKLQNGGHKVSEKSLSSSPPHNSFEVEDLAGILNLEEKDDKDFGDEGPSSTYPSEDVNSEPVDFDNNGLLWLPPEPEDEEDEMEALPFDDGEGEGDARGEWGYLCASNSFGSGESRSRDKSGEEHKRPMKNVVDGHFRALVAQLLQVENLPVGEENDKENWLEIITCLSWEAAMLLKPDMSKGGGMDPGGYVKVKCIASGHRHDSMVVKGVVCKKNVAHRQMTSKIEKPRLLILGGALEYQRVSNHLSSFDTLLQQEMDHLKMAVAKIDAHQPNVLLVEKSVSRFAQDYLLAKDISLVLNIKRPLLERIARCTGAQLVSSVDHLSAQKLGYCETFHVERFLEDLDSAEQGGKKLLKTLMYFEGCPEPLGCTILLKGAKRDELKKVKDIVQYGVFAAYHLALETSFLADEGASLPELPLESPITVALPDKPSRIERSISTVPGFSIPAHEKSQGPGDEPQRSNSLPTPDLNSLISINPPFLNGPNFQSTQSTLNVNNSTTLVSSVHSSGTVASKPYHNDLTPDHSLEDKNEMDFKQVVMTECSSGNSFSSVMTNHLDTNGFEPTEAMGQSDLSNICLNHQSTVVANQINSSDLSSLERNSPNTHGETVTLKREPIHLKEDFLPLPSDHQRILVSLSSRCVWKGTVCERSHLFRIKYYGSFDKPLGRFLHDNLFDQGHRCRSCEMPSEAHVHCYTHRQGTLTISVKKLPKIILPGERDGKIWMWHRCLRCPRTNGFPPATLRVVMSDAAWGLSFGKFLELSFSNHAAASRVASCGHSLHRDCLRFYGFGKMVACFRYASIDVHSVFLPPSKLDFRFKKQEWIQKEVDEVVSRAEFLFSEVNKVLHQISQKLSAGLKISDWRHQISDLEGILQKEKADFEESLQKILNKEVTKAQPVIDILEINQLRRKLLFQSYMWDHNLIYAASVDNDSQNALSRSTSETKLQEESDSHRPPLVDEKTEKDLCNRELFSGDDKEANVNNQEMKIDQDPDRGKEKTNFKKSYQSVHLESRGNVRSRRAFSDGQFSFMADLSDTLDAAWTGENQPIVGIRKNNSFPLADVATADSSTTSANIECFDLDENSRDQNTSKSENSLSPPALSGKFFDYREFSASWLGTSFLNFYRSFNKNFLASSQKLNTLGQYNPVYISSFRESDLQGGARLLLPMSPDGILIPIYDCEPTSIISYALVSSEYHVQIGDEAERLKENDDFIPSLYVSDSVIHTSDEVPLESHRSFGSSEDNAVLSSSGSRSSLGLGPPSYMKALLHARVSFGDDGPLGKVKYNVTCYHAKRFEALRRLCCPSELDYVRSLSRCRKWGAQGGKSNVFFAKTLDDRFIIKQVTKTELESFLKFAPEYFKYLSESIGTGSPTCLAKILGIYQVTSKYLKGGKESKMDVLVMENLLFGRNVTRLYDLKGSSRSRYNPDSTGNNKVLLDQNLIEAMPTSPIFVGNKAKQLLERAVWNDTLFLASIDVMDYSLLVGVDEEKHELVLGIIDFMRQYTWDKHLETWVKASGILGGPKNASPTVISPKQYKKRFRKAMTTYFIMVPDQWSPRTIVPSKSQSDLCEEKENTQGGTKVE